MYLNCKTYFSFRYGVMPAEKLVEEAVAKGVQYIALTNINSTADHWDFYKACNDAGIRPVLGLECRNGDELMYIILARDMEGLQALNTFLSHHLQQSADFPEECPLSDSVYVVYPLSREAFAKAKHEFIGVQPSEVPRLFSLQNRWERCVVRQPVTFTDKRSYNLHRLLRAIDKNILLSRQQPGHIAAPTENFPAPEELFRAFKGHPQMVTRTIGLLEDCTYTFDASVDKNKKQYSATPEDDRILLEKLAIDGLHRRYGRRNREAFNRVRKELDIIHKLGFNAYFLMAWDVIRYAQNRGFYYVGRGSGANSIVAYCLQITDVDPIALDLYFERFLNPYRTSPPDFDIDFSWKDRDEVIDYIFKRYGRQHVALLGMYSTFKRRAAIRELGKVFGLPKNEIDALAADARASMTDDKIQQQIRLYGSLMQGLPNHFSIHPGGMLISEEPITRYTAVGMPPKGFSTTQIDMFIAEDIGLYKLDILSQRGLGHIREAIELVEQNTGKRIDITRVQDFMKDKRVTEKIRAADTIGCFYIESPAMRQLLLKLRCSDYLTLVAASSIIRPGVAQSGMMRQYIYYYHHPDEVKYLHPKMKELLEETYGVMVYQEDVIKVAHHFAGLDMGEADVLRRAMSGKYRGGGGFLKIKNTFFEHCKARGYPDALSQEVWRQIESFAGYSFSKAHSASFAVESYQSLYLKTYFPVEFMVAVINNFGGFYSTELYFHELKRAGAVLHAPCVNTGDELTAVHNRNVYMGFVHVRGLQQQLIGKLVEEREANGAYSSLSNFVERVSPEMEQLNLLIRSGAFRFTGKPKRSLLWEAYAVHQRYDNAAASPALFHDEVTLPQLPDLDHFPHEDVLDEIELFGFPLNDSFDFVDADFVNTLTAREFYSFSGKRVSVIGYFITSKPVRTAKGDFMYFGTFLDRNGDWVDTVHFPESASRFALQGNGFYKMTGILMEDFGVYTLEVREMIKLGVVCNAGND